MKNSRLIGALAALALMAGVKTGIAAQYPTLGVTGGAFTMTASGPVPATNATILCDATNGNVTFTLPHTLGQAEWLIVTKLDSTANTCAPAVLSGDSLLNSAAATLAIQHQSMEFRGVAANEWAAVTNGSNVINSSGVSICPSTNLTGADNVTFAKGASCQASILTANETLTLADSRTVCSTTVRCASTHMLCQNATGNFTVTWSNSNINWLNGATAPPYPLTASGAGANCVKMYFEYNGANFDEVGQSAFFAGP